jgi:hypothetical protein
MASNGNKQMVYMPENLIFSVTSKGNPIKKFSLKKTNLVSNIAVVFTLKYIKLL